METSVEDGENKTIGEDCFNLLPGSINLFCLQSLREIAGQGQRKVVILLQVENLPIKNNTDGKTNKRTRSHTFYFPYFLSCTGGQTVCSCLTPLCNCPSCPMPLRSRSGAGLNFTQNIVSEFPNLFLTFAYRGLCFAKPYPPVGISSTCVKNTP